jgi:hypothetical protein
MADEKLAERMAALAEGAVKLAREDYETELDYSEESLQRVEEILGRLYLDIPRGWRRIFHKRPSAKQLEAMCQLFGAYIGEVARRRWDGQWHTDTTFGRPVAGLSVLGGDIYPVNKVYKRLMDGEGDSVWAYYQMLKQVEARGA